MPRPEIKRQYWIEMTGSPKNFGFKTKEKFLETVKDFNVYHTNITNCQYLITDDITSNTIKMKTARKHGVKIFTYGEFVNLFKVEMRSKKIIELQKKMLETK